MSRRRVVAAGVGLAIALFVLWWTWPTITGEGDEVDVVVALDARLAVAEESLAERIRENGDLVELVRVDDWCVDPSGLLASDADRVVVPFTGDVACVASLVDAVEGEVLVLVAPDQDPSGIAPAGAVVVDPSPMLGAPGEAVACQWWEDCPDGSVVTVAADGTLTVIGGERLARVLVADL